MNAAPFTPLTIEVMSTCRINRGAETVAPTPGAAGLLAILADRRATPVNVTELRRSLWTSPPDSAVSMIRGYVRELRAHLGAQAVETIQAPRGCTGAYRLAVTADATDIGRFRRAGRFGDQAHREGHQLGALAYHAEALAVWTGGIPPHMTATPRLEALAREWQRVRAGLVERYAADAAAAGLGDRAAAEIATLHYAHPERAEAERLYRLICAPV